MRDETCRIVSVIPEVVDEEVSTARADFYVAVEVLIPAEMRCHRLNEGTRQAWREEGGEFLYTRERMVEFMGSEIYMKRCTRVGIDGQMREWPERLEDL